MSGTAAFQENQFGLLALLQNKKLDSKSKAAQRADHVGDLPPVGSILQPDCSYKRGSWGFQKLRAMEEHRPGRAVKDSCSYFQPLTLSSCLFLGNMVAELKLPPKKAQTALKNLKASHADLWHDGQCHSTLSQPLAGAVGFLPHPPSRKQGEEHIPPPTIPRDQMHSRPQSSRRSQ